MSGPPRQLDADQVRVYQAVVSAIRGLPTTKRYFFITGFAGTGKTHLVKAILEELSQDMTPITLCWAGVAARNLCKDARTLMSYCGLEYDATGIPGDNAFMRSSDELKKRMVQGLRRHHLQDVRCDTAVLLLDEMQAIHSSVLDGFSEALREIRKDREGGDLPFGGIPVIVTGDPCQIGRVSLMTSMTYSAQEFPEKPCWLSRTWQVMDPLVFYMTTFHRGQDNAYVKMLSEIRTTPVEAQGMPLFSPNSIAVLEAIRDRDAGQKAPRFHHTILCLTNGEAELHNWKHLEQLEGNEVVFNAVDTRTPSTPPDFNIEDVSKLGYRTSVELKKGCRIMATINHPRGVYVNGLQGTVVDITMDDELPRVLVRFDGSEDDVEIRPEKYVLHDSNGELLFSREQLPLMLAAAITAHRAVGLTLTGVWAQLPFKGCPKSRNADIAAYWCQEWLRGCMYTIMSRVGSRQAIRIHPLRHGDIMPIFWMDPEAIRFDTECRSNDWLTNETPIDDPRLHSPSAAHGPSHKAPMLHLEHLIDDLAKKFDSASSSLMTGLTAELQLNLNKTLIHNHYTAIHSQRIQGGQPSVHVVAHTMSRPSLCSSIDKLPSHLQWAFYEQLDEYLNIQKAEADDSAVLKLIRNLRTGDAESEINGSSSDGEHRDGHIHELLHSGQPAPELDVESNEADEANPNAISSPTSGPRSPPEEDPSEGRDMLDEPEEENGVDDLHDTDDDLLSNAFDDTDDEDDECNSILAKGPGSGRDRFEERPFLICRGPLHTIVEAFLTEHPHYRLTRTTLKRLKTEGSSCIIECMRTISYRNVGKPLVRGSKPDWRCWPHDTCPMAEVCIAAKDGINYFYGVTSANASASEWCNHAHPEECTRCRSSYVPPPIVDDWMVKISQNPSCTKGQLIEWAMAKYLNGGYSNSPHTIEFLASKKLTNNSEKVRDVLRSIRPYGRSGLSVEAFLDALAVKKCSIEHLEAKVGPLISRLRTFEAGETNEAAALIDIDRCIVLGETLCNRGSAEHGRFPVKEFCLVATSARMLSNLENATTLGIDCSFNIALANVAILVVCSLERSKTASPIAIALVHAESASSVEHCMRQLQAAGRALGFQSGEGHEIVMDGSASIYSACTTVFGEFDAISCFFHVMKRAKEAKARAGLPKALWLEIRRDLWLLADAVSRSEWEKLARLFIAKWTEDRPRVLTPIGRDAVSEFISDFGSYLAPDSWRSNWGQYAAERSGPRTNNAVEKMNRMIKEEVTDNRRRRTLHEFAAYLSNDAAWAKISQYGHQTNKGEIQTKHRRSAAKILARESLCQIPKTWEKGALNVDHSISTPWLFLNHGRRPGCEPLSCHINSGDEIGKSARKFYESAYSSLDEAHDAANTFCMVCYSNSGVSNSYCTCVEWRKSLMCRHLAAAAYLSGGDNSGQAKEQWKSMNVYFRQARRNRGRDGRIEENVLTSDVRYGIGQGRSSRMQKRRRSTTGASAPSEAPNAKRRRIVIKGAH